MNIHPTEKPLILSPQQQGVVDFVRYGSGSAFVEAVAGSGKTTVLIEALKATKGSVAFAAYNAAIADEIKAKVAPLGFGNRVRVGTFHSFGFGAWRYVYKNVQAGPQAARDKADRTAAQLKINPAIRPFVEKLVSLAKQRALGVYGSVSDHSRWYEIVDHFDLAYEIEDPELIKEGVETAIEALAYHRSIADQIIDFDDMVYMPVVSAIKMWQNDWLLGDEMQDANGARRALCRRMIGTRGRALFVGDRHQAIYGFSGADNDSIEQLMRDFSCKLLPLTVTYRCPKAVVTLAQTVVNHIVAAPEAPEGLVRTIQATDISKEGLGASDAILCRNTKPLVMLAYELIRKGVPCHVEGKDIGVGLLTLANKYKARNIEDLRDKLEAFRDREVAKLVAKGKETQAESLADRVDTVVIMMEGCRTVGDLTSKIAAMFIDSKDEARPTLTLATAHRSKGREWDRVFIYGHSEYMPSKWARQQWQMDQEDNLIYVAYTRAKRELVLAETV